MSKAKTARLRDRVTSWNPESSNIHESRDFALSEIDRVGEALDIPTSTLDLSKELYDQANDHDLVRGRSVEAVAYGCLVISLRVTNVTRSISEIVETTRFDKDKITRTYLYIADQIGYTDELSPVEPEEYVNRYIDELDIEDTDEVEELTNRIINVARQNGLLSGKSPSGCAGAAIYVAAKELGIKVVQSDISTVSKVSRVTIRARYSEMKEAWDESDEDVRLA